MASRDQEILAKDMDSGRNKLTFAVTEPRSTGDPRASRCGGREKY